MAETYNIPTLLKGDTFRDLQFTVSLNSSPLDLTNYTLECKFRKGNKRGQVALSIDNTSGITITDAVNGVFKIDAFTCDFDVATYYYDIEFTSGSGVIDTYIEGTFKVVQDVTY